MKPLRGGSAFTWDDGDGVFWLPVPLQPPYSFDEFRRRFVNEVLSGELYAVELEDSRPEIGGTLRYVADIPGFRAWERHAMATRRFWWHQRNLLRHGQLEREGAEEEGVAAEWVRTGPAAQFSIVEEAELERDVQEIEEPNASGSGFHQIHQRIRWPRGWAASFAVDVRRFGVTGGATASLLLMSLDAAGGFLAQEVTSVTSDEWTRRVVTFTPDHADHVYLRAILRVNLDGAGDAITLRAANAMLALGGSDRVETHQNSYEVQLVHPQGDRFGLSSDPGGRGQRGEQAQSIRIRGVREEVTDDVVGTLLYE